MKNEILKRIISSLILIPIAFFFIIKGSIFFIFFLGIFFLLASYEWIKMSKSKLIKFIGIIYLLFSSWTAYLLQDFSVHYFLFVIIICISTDVGGYVFGKLFKGPKLTKISPKKTYSGVTGSYFISIISTYFFVNEFNIGLNNDSEFLIWVILISTISQLGDLTISYFKRLAKIKNTGILLPGHGGLLDRADGIIFAVPFALIFNYF